MLARFTSAQVKPPPVTLVTVIPPALIESLDTNASKSSFAVEVEKTFVLTEALAEVLSPEEMTSIASCPGGGSTATMSVTSAVCITLPAVAVTVSG